jgi:hypothetical protein
MWLEEQQRQQKKTNEKGRVKINKIKSYCREYHKATRNRFFIGHRLLPNELKEKPKKMEESKRRS